MGIYSSEVMRELEESNRYNDADPFKDLFALFGIVCLGLLLRIYCKPKRKDLDYS